MLENQTIYIEDSLMPRFKGIFENAIRFDPEALPKEKDEKSVYVLLISESGLRSMEDCNSPVVESKIRNLIVFAPDPIEKSTSFT